ncbi:MAG: ATP-binding protein [Sedimentitalea sp.]
MRFTSSDPKSPRVARRHRRIRRFLRRFIPHSLYGLSAAVLIVPITLVQLIVSISFVQRVYEDITRQMTRNMVFEINLLQDSFLAGQDIARYREALALEVEIGTGPSQERRAFFDIAGATIIKTLHEQVPSLKVVDLVTHRRQVHLSLQTDRGDLHVSFHRNRVTVVNPHQLLVLIVFISVLMTILAFVFLRKQLRPVRQLAQAAEAFGRGEHRAYAPGGPDEIRAAGEAFLSMRERIIQHQEQRTLLLSGVSHDLRTPLTRLRLGMSLNEHMMDDPGMIADLDEMEHLIDSFLDFVRSDTGEDPEPTDLVEMVRHTVEKTVRGGGAVSIGTLPPTPQILSIKRLALGRALDNLVGNALRYANRAVVSLEVKEDLVCLIVEDDGPGIPQHLRHEALKPFSRLDPSRNQDKGGGLGLGLAITMDIVLSHGGALTLDESTAHGGLLARIELPMAVDFQS